MEPEGDLEMLTPVDLTDFFWAKMVMFTQDGDFGQ
jgi:hypothetical protein